MSGKHRRQASQEDVNSLSEKELENLKQALKDNEDFPPKSGELPKGEK